MHSLPTDAQGAAFDRDGALWVARSDIEWGLLERRDPVTGDLVRRHIVAPATEGIAFDQQGRLWAVSEAGAKRFYTHPVGALLPFTPLIYALDPDWLVW